MKRPGYFLLAFLLMGAFGLAADFMRRTPASNEAAGGAATKPEAPPSDPAGRVAYEFLDAAIKADEQRLSACLTQTAIQRLIESGKRIGLPGVEAMNFRIGEIRKQGESQAMVQCFLTDTSKAGELPPEEVCCFVRQDGAEWRVCGIAYYSGENHSTTIVNFESEQSEPMGLPVTPQAANDLGTQPVSQRPSPGRAAVETPRRLFASRRGNPPFVLDAIAKMQALGCIFFS